MSQLLIGYQNSQHVAIEVLCRSHPGATDYWDGNWVKARINVVVAGFQGRVDADPRAEDFEGLRIGLVAWRPDGALRLMNTDNSVAPSWINGSQEIRTH